MNHNLFVHLIPNLVFNSVTTYFIFFLLIELLLWVLPIKSHNWKFLFRLIPVAKVVFNFFLYNLRDWSIYQGIHLHQLEKNSKNLSLGIGIIKSCLFNVSLCFKTEGGAGSAFSFFDLITASMKSYCIVCVCYFLIILSLVRVGLFLKNCLKERHFLSKEHVKFDTSELSDSLKKRLIEKKVSIKESTYSNQSPLVHGLFKSKIILPKHIRKRLSLNEVESVIYHELAHIERFDLWTTPVLKLIQALIPGLPLYLLSQTREKACDERALRSHVTNLNLSQAIYKLAQVRRTQNSITSHPFIIKNKVRGRVKNILLKQRVKKYFILDIISFILLLYFSYCFFRSDIGYF
ncbi:MAG: hypothetical protein S4CHLAM7_12830 [Chlamydiae bacterium]|nr:hypothetical protein [Chlamydiota bacterium]